MALQLSQPVPDAHVSPELRPKEQDLPALHHELESLKALQNEKDKDIDHLNKSLKAFRK